MICLRCGYCCLMYEVIIVSNPDLGVVEGNLVAKHTGDRCPHLRGEGIGEFSCAIHDKSWYEQTPCWQFTQIEWEESNCRLGVKMTEIGWKPPIKEERT